MSTKSDHAGGAALLAPPPPEAGKAGGAPRGGTIWSFLAGCALGATLSLLLVTVFVLPTAGRRAGREEGGTISPVLGGLDRTNQEAPHWNPLSSEYVPPPLWHTMSDEELYKNALALDEVPLSPEAELFPKIAFLFLVRGPIPMAALWNRYFWGHEGKYSIYVHAHPDFEHPPGDGPHLFVNRSIPSQLVLWKDFSLVRASKRLLANALRDRGNEHFVLVSDACIPLFNFSFAYEYLTSSSLDYVERLSDPRVWARGLMPELRGPADLAKGLHWFALRRDAARHVIADARFFRKLRRHCNPDHSPPHCEHYFPDEFYVHTVLHNAPAFAKRMSNSTLTWNVFPPASAHPRVYCANNTDVAAILADVRRRRCRYPGEEHAKPCFLFSRKWDVSTRATLLDLAKRLLEI